MALRNVLNTRLIIVILLLVLAYLILRLPISDDYQVNLVTECLGVVVTVVLVDYLYRRAEQRQQKVQHDKTLITVDVLLSIYIDKYEYYLNILTSDKYDKARILGQIKLSDLQHIYDPAFLTAGPFFIKKYSLYFDALEKLIEAIKLSIVRIDAPNHWSVSTLLQSFITVNDILFLRKKLDERFTTNYGNKPGWKEDVERLKLLNDETISLHQKRADVSLYEQLLKSIQANIKIINSYRSYVNGVQKQHGIHPIDLSSQRPS